MNAVFQVNGSLDYHKIHTKSVRADGLSGLPGPDDPIKLVPVPMRTDLGPPRAYPYSNSTWGCTIDGWKPQAAISMTGPDGLQEVILANYWKPPDRKSPHMHAKGPRLQLMKLKDPVPKEFSDLMSPLGYSAAVHGVTAVPQGPRVPQGPGVAQAAVHGPQVAQTDQNGATGSQDPWHPWPNWT